jgi:glycerophosphoryl diester phosphodiesterase
MMRRGVLNIAHRGASAEFPENTLIAFAAAITAGADMCELDVQRSADGALIVMHDDSVERTTDGKGKVAALKLETIKRLDAGTWFASRFAGERVPLLSEVFELAHGHCALNIELKAPEVAAQVCDLIGEWHTEQSTLISSFDWHELAQVRRIAPELRIGLLASRGPSRLLEAAVKMKAAAINPSFELITAEYCDRAHRNGLAIYTWTVDDPAQMRRLIIAGADGIMTNHPKRLRAVVES